MEAQEGQDVRQPAQVLMTDKWRSWDLNPLPSHSKDCSTALHKFSSFSLDSQSLDQSSILILRRIALYSLLGSHSELPWTESTTCTLAQCLPFREQTRGLLSAPRLLLQTSPLTSTSLCREPTCSISFLGAGGMLLQRNQRKQGVRLQRAPPEGHSQGV